MAGRGPIPKPAGRRSRPNRNAPEPRTLDSSRRHSQSCRTSASTPTATRSNGTRAPSIGGACGLTPSSLGTSRRPIGHSSRTRHSCITRCGRKASGPLLRRCACASRRWAARPRIVHGSGSCSSRRTKRRTKASGGARTPARNSRQNVRTRAACSTLLTPTASGHMLRAIHKAARQSGNSAGPTPRGQAPGAPGTLSIRSAVPSSPGSVPVRKDPSNGTSSNHRA